MYYFNDRYGLGRIYYYQAPDAFYFFSEAKALLKALPFLRELDVRSLGEFVSCDCVLQDPTIFHAIRILPAGSAWIFRPNVVLEKRLYFNPSTCEDQPRISPEVYHKSVGEIFLRVFKRYPQYPVGEHFRIP